MIVRVNVVLNALFSIERSVACVAAGPYTCILLYSIHVYTEGLEICDAGKRSDAMFIVSQAST